jgi:hypothetical protein
MEQWTLQHRLFAHHSFVPNGESITATLRLFRREFNVDRHAAVPRHASDLGLSRESVRCILQADLRFHPHKMQVVQQLNVRDYTQRVGFAVRMQVILEENKNAIMSDEAHFI